MIDTLLQRKDRKSVKDIEKLSQRDRFSDYLPWFIYNQDNEVFINSDNTLGVIWECRPLNFCDDHQLQALEGILQQNFPKGSILQWILFPDHNISDFIEQYKANKIRKDDLAQKTVDEYASYLEASTSGMKATHGIPVRNFRLLVCFKSPDNLDPDQISFIEEVLTGCGLCPKKWNDEQFVEWAREFFKGNKTRESPKYDRKIMIRKQIIDADEVLNFKDGSMVRLGSRYARCMTPKSLPEEFNSLKLNKMFGGYEGRQDDLSQITSPFLYSLNIVFDEQSSSITTKADLLMSMKATGSFAKAVQRRLNEYSWALDTIAGGSTGKFHNVIPCLWVFGDTQEQVRDACSRVHTMWEALDFKVQNETILSKIMLISSLPFGLYNIGKNLVNMDRHFLMPISTISKFIPIQADFQSPSRPVLAYIGRKGQVSGIDVFDPRSDNHNFLVAAGSGSGKSFGLGFLASNYYAAGAMVRIIDIGGSYEKLTRTSHGVFLDFAKEAICINPLDYHYVDEDDRASNQLSAAYVITEMCFSGTGEPATETQWTLIKRAVEWADRSGRNLEGVDAVQEYLSEYPKHVPEGDLILEKAVNVAKELAFNLTDFTSRGRYGKYFNGKSTFDISNDEFVVIELENLKPQKELFAVVMMQIMNKVTEDLYLSDRSTPRFIIVEEAATLLKKNGMKDLSRLAGIVEEGYRRARKYTGSFGVVLQSLLDLKGFGTMGDVLLANAAYRFLLYSKNHAKAIDEKMVDYSGLASDLLESVRNVKPRYSEMFVDTPFGKGVVRLSVDPWGYHIYNSEGSQKKIFDTLIKNGVAPYEAIKQMSGIA